MIKNIYQKNHLRTYQNTFDHEQYYVYDMVFNIFNYSKIKIYTTIRSDVRLPVIMICVANQKPVIWLNISCR